MQSVIPASAQLRTLVLAGGMQAGVQVLLFAAGLVVIRLLPVEEYAYYTLAQAALGTLMVLTDSGISNGVIAQGGKVWQDRSRLGSVIGSGIRLRRRFAAAASLVAVPVLYLLLRRQGAGAAYALLVSASILPLFLASLTGQILEIVPRLDQRIGALQRIQVAGAGLRVAMVAALTAVVPMAWLANLASGLCQAWATWRTRILARSLADLDAPAEPAVTGAIVTQVARTLPWAVYFAVSGQLTVWIISLLGGTAAVAQVGALGRLAMAFNLVGSVISLVWVPRFARIQTGDRARVLARFWQAQAGVALVMTIAVAGVAAFPHWALAVLGPGYASLSFEVVLTAIGGAIHLLFATAYALGAARGIVPAPWVVVPVAILVQSTLVLTLPVSTVAGVLWLALLSNLAFWLMHVVSFTVSVAARPSVKPN